MLLFGRSDVRVANYYALSASASWDVLSIGFGQRAVLEVHGQSGTVGATFIR